MGNIKMNHLLIRQIPDPIVNNIKLTAACSLTIVGTTLFVLKSKTVPQGQLYPMCLIKISDFNSNPTITMYPIVDKNNSLVYVNHANSITYADGYLYITTMNEASKPQVLKVNKIGIVQKEIYYIKNNKKTTIKTITYIGKDTKGYLKFIVGINKVGGNYRYHITKMKTGNLQYADRYFSVAIPNSYTTSNDICYKNGKLYATFFKKNSENIIRNNGIVCSNINNVSSGAVLSPKCVYIDNANTSDIKYEIEGTILYNDTIYVLANRKTEQPENNGDGIFKLKKKV